MVCNIGIENFMPYKSLIVFVLIFVFVKTVSPLNKSLSVYLTVMLIFRFYRQGSGR